MSEDSRDILLIEPSRTQRYVLVKMLRCYGYEISMAESFDAGVDFLSNPDQLISHPPAIVLSWPEQTMPAADELLSLLESEPYRHIPVLVVTYEPDQGAKAWVARRARTAVLEWPNRKDIVEILQTLFAAQELPSISEAPSARNQQPVHILLVDDSPSVRSYYRKLLVKHGYEVDVASCVEEGFNKADQASYDIAIVDYFMPDANGDILCRRLQQNDGTRDIAIAMFTGTYLDQVIKNALDAGATECMFKNEVDALFLARVAAMSRAIRSKASIEAQRQRLQSILHSVGDGVYGVDNSGRISFINPTAIRILGYNSELELLGADPADVFHHSDEYGQPLSRTACKLQRSYGQADTLQNWETVFWNRSGNMLPVQCTIYPMYLDGHQAGSVVAFQDISERKTLEEKLRWQATHDPLTELFNRRYFEEQLEQELERLTRSEETSALLYIDIDRFKYINDTAGHDAGDKLLVRIGQILRGRLRSTDTLARLGGDEFAVLLRNVEPDLVETTADAFRSIMAESCFYFAGKSYRIQGSVGVAVFGDNTESPGNALANADIACQLAKKEGGNQTHVYLQHNDYRSELGNELGWSARVREAIEQNQFELYFHPILPVSSIALDQLPDEAGAIWDQISANPSRVDVCFEVLLRLKAGDSSVIMPGAFIPTAERFHLMPDIDFWVLRKAIQSLKQFQRIWKGVVFSINLAGQTLAKQELVPNIKDLIQQYQVDPASLAFEITETTAIANLAAAQRVINELTALGCQFSLDDFGTGFSSFSHLKHLNVDCVKIDGLFVRGMTKDPTDHAMVISMNDIAHFLGQKTVAEYVETADSLKLLAECGVDFVQGYYISQPIPESVARCEKTEDDSAPVVMA